VALDSKTQTEISKKKSFNIQDLSDREKELFKFTKERILELKKARQNVFGQNIEEIWRDADRDYVPHKLKSPGKKVVVTDEDKGWRGSLVTLGKSEDWQFDAPKPNPYIKIQTALAILIDRNPSGVFTPAAKKFEKTNALIKSLYSKNWEKAKSKQQLKLFAYNLAKYGWAIARTFPLKITSKVRALKEYNEENPENSVYEEKEVVEYNDVFRENLDVWNAWIDDMAKPNNEMSVKDWCWRKVYSWDQAEQEFSSYKNWKYVKPGGDIAQITEQGDRKVYQDTNLLEVYFYENKLKDLFMVVANDIPLIIEPLPVSDNEGRKMLSLWQTYWTLRHAESPYGIGIYEAIRNDSIGLNRVRCMSVDQLVLSIYKMFFYQGTTSLTEEGNIKIAPGVGKQVIDPKNINWLQVPGPGREAVEWIQYFQKDIDEASGITDPLMGEVTGKTAFEIAQAKEAALKRLKTPLENVCDALETDGYISIDLFQLIYSIPELIKITDKNLIEEYLKEIKGDPELYERNETGEFTAKVYREIQLGLEEDENGNLVESKESRFFRIKPKSLAWEGIINIDAQSILTPSKELSKALDLEMLNIVAPLMSNTTAELIQGTAMGEEKSINETTFGKLVKNILKIYDKDPADWLPDSWLERPSMLEGQPLIVPQGQVMQGMQPGAPQGMSQGAPQPLQGQPMPQPGQTMAGQVTMPQRPGGVGSKLVSGFVNRLMGRVKNA